MHKKSQIKFLIYFAVFFIVFFILLYSAGLVPGLTKNQEGNSLRTLWDKAQSGMIIRQINRGVVKGEEPVRIVIDNIGVDTSISNPNTTNVVTLDEYLKQGAVRYPDSGLLGIGNMFVFAHSAEAFNIRNNQALKAFNGLSKLKKGNIIKVYGKNRTYFYKVTSVFLVDNTKALVEFNNRKNMLTLSTCNTFGAKSERYVVEADYIRSE